jgi:hypothetical protein
VSEPRTETVDVPSASLAYDVRDAEDATTEPPLLLIGLPMDAGGFTTLAGLFPDRTVVTYDVGTTHYEPDFEALRAAPTRIVIGVGAESEGEMAHRGGLGVAERLGIEPVTFPSHHGGFLGPDSGYAGEPEAFAVTLRKALAG